jgi:hypothetical protein
MVTEEPVTDGEILEAVNLSTQHRIVYVELEPTGFALTGCDLVYYAHQVRAFCERKIIAVISDSFGIGRGKGVATAASSLFGEAPFIHFAGAKYEAGIIKAFINGLGVSLLDGSEGSGDEESGAN